MTDKNILIEPSMFVQKKLGNFQKLCEEYEILNKKLGEGFFGSVEVVQLKCTKQNRAMKKVDKKQLEEVSTREELLQEIEILKTLDHPNILKVYEFYEDKKNLYIITELCNGSQLFDVLVERNYSFSESETMKIMQQCLSALQYAHAKYFIHRDLKLENIMIDPNTLKLKIIDWGTSVQCKDEKIIGLVGSPEYIAPEIVKRKRYNEKVDLWSLGMVFYSLLSGQTPFESKQTLLILEEIKTVKINLDGENWDNISNECKDLIKRMLTHQPSKRISASQALKHPWFNTQPSTVPRKLLQNKLHSMKTFKYQSKLQMATIQYVASHLMSQQEKEELSDLFVHLDTNKDGKLSRKEIYEGYKEQYGDKEAQEIVNNVFNEIDVDNNGTIDYNEFLACTMKKQKLMSQNTLKRAFDLFDVDGDKQITAQEIKSVLENNASSFDSQMWDSVIGEVDKDGNGVIDFNEFQDMMDNLVDQQSQNKRNTNFTPFSMITRSKAKIIEEISEENESDDEDDIENAQEINLKNKVSILLDDNECKTPKKGIKELPQLTSGMKSSSKKEKLHRFQSDDNESEESGNNIKKQIKKN